jgi:hypothetical protein
MKSFINTITLLSLVNCGYSGFNYEQADVKSEYMMRSNQVHVVLLKGTSDRPELNQWLARVTERLTPSVWEGMTFILIPCEALIKPGDTRRVGQYQTGGGLSDRIVVRDCTPYLPGAFAHEWTHRYLQVMAGDANAAHDDTFYNTMERLAIELYY